MTIIDGIRIEAGFVSRGGQVVDLREVDESKILYTDRHMHRMFHATALSALLVALGLGAHIPGALLCYATAAILGALLLPNRVLLVLTHGRRISMFHCSTVESGERIITAIHKEKTSCRASNI